MTDTLLLEELVLPQTPDAEDAADFLAVVALNNAVCRNDAGTDDLAQTPAEMLAGLRDTDDEVQRIFVVREEGAVVGCVIVSHATAEPTSTQFDLMVLPENWGRGIEDALLARAEEETHALGRAVMQTWTLHPGATAGATISPATGWGVVADTPLARLLAHDGFVLEQVERNSAFDLAGPMDDVRQALDDSIAAAGPDYRLVDWTIPTPPDLAEGYAWALSRMSTDVPAGALEIDEETWDAARVERREARLTEGGQTMSVAAVLHVPTGRLAAFNELVIGADRSEVTHQFCTLVLREHRGHRLGMLVKCANLLRWREIAPDSPRVSTFNAEENRPMLDINERIGFAPVSYAGAWQKKLG
ncbi:GNAT family N-acetyltransferase [Microbacterium sp. CIAB417]|uniref:GNAT family N-acetyltransferase n=1 Tax=Microbacterium sp. CIAB417 TaxID=2860287 RepID=UPI001FADF83C|nr:GNAT family N-acetyltransferase [Microbacterium sp. CIAB417]